MSLHGSWPNRDVWRSSNVASPPAAVFCILFHGLLGDFLFRKQFILPSMFPLEGAFCWRVSCSFPSYTQLCLLRHASATVHAENYISEISGLKKKKGKKRHFFNSRWGNELFSSHGHLHRWWDKDHSQRNRPM